MSLKFSKLDLVALIIIILSSLIFQVDGLITGYQPANMDGKIHAISIQMFSQALKSGDFPVRWLDGFANYGLPMGSFNQQLTAYLGAIINFMTHNPVIALNLVYLLATLSSALLFYFFLRLYFKVWPSLVGALIFNYAPYRVINLYIRGAVPEYFAVVFLASLLISLYYLFEKRTWWAYLGLALSVTGIILSHPMNVVTSIFLAGPYTLYLFFKAKRTEWLKLLVLLISSSLLGVALSSYYLLPLLKEIKFFYYGLQPNHYTFGSTLNLESFFSPSW